MTDDSVLLSDQVFQLNTFLWALEDIPEGGPNEPVLSRAGYSLGAIGRPVIVPKEEAVIAALGNLIGSTDQSASHPDLWLHHSSDVIDPVIELKARGFSVKSSNRRQALKMITSATDLSPSLGEASKRPGHVVYATVSSDAEDLSGTLRQLAGDLRSEGVPAAPTGVLGFSMETEGVALSSPRPEELPPPAAQAFESPAIVLRRDGDNDLQPLYFIPWIPGNDKSQHPDLRSAGLTELSARVLTHALAQIAQAQVPATVTLDGPQLLGQATFGIFDRWRDSDRKQFGKAVAAIIERALSPVVEVRKFEGQIVEVDLPDSDTQDTVIERPERANPSDPGSNLEEEIEAPPKLFDL